LDIVVRLFVLFGLEVCNITLEDQRWNIKEYLVWEDGWLRLKR